MSYRQGRRGVGGGGYDADPWITGSGWGAGGQQQMWNDGGYGGGYGGGAVPAYQQSHYVPQMQQRPHNRNLNQGGGQYHSNQNRFAGRQPQHQRPGGGAQRGVKRLGGQNFNNGGVAARRRPQANNQRQNQRPNQSQNKNNSAGTNAAAKKTKTEGNKDEQEAFCNICQEKFEGTYNQHKLTKPHREKRAQKYPSCGPCGLKFNGDDARSRYEVHLGSKAHMQVVETADLEIKEGQEPEGTDLCQDIEASFCTLCEALFKKDHIDTHCKTKGHLKRITKKKAEAERAAKKADEEAKKAAEKAAKKEGDSEEKKEDDAEADENGDAEEGDNAEEGDEGEGEEEEGEGEEGDGDEEDAEGEDEEGDGEGEGDEEMADAEDGDEAVEADQGEAVPEQEEAAPEEEEVEPEPAAASKTPRKATRGRGRGKGRK